MATYSKILLSGSTDGKQILIAATSSAGDTIHTAVTGTDDLDEIYIYAANISSSNTVTLTIEFGDALPGTNIDLLPKSGLNLIVPGSLLQNGNVVKAYASVTNNITIFGHVNRITA